MGLMPKGFFDYCWDVVHGFELGFVTFLVVGSVSVVNSWLWGFDYFGLGLFDYFVGVFVVCVFLSVCFVISVSG